MDLNHEYTPEDYKFPRLYVVGKNSSDTITLYPDKNCYIKESKKDGIKAGLIAYEAGWNLIFDPIEAKVIRPFAIMIPWMKNRIIYVENELELKLVEAKGIQVYLVSREGDKIDKKDIMAYIVTNKGETRTLRSPTDGVVVYIAWKPLSAPERYIYLLVDPEKTRILNPFCSN